MGSQPENISDAMVSAFDRQYIGVDDLEPPRETRRKAIAAALSQMGTEK